MGYQALSVSGGEVQCPPDGSGLRLIATLPYCVTHFSSSGMQVFGSTPGDCGSIAAGMKLSGKSSPTRKQSSLQMAAQVDETSKSPMWCAMKLARGEKMVRSLPRSCIFFSWLETMVSRSSSSLIFSSLAFGRLALSWRLAICRLRHSSSALGAVV
jgi:hypothetical protein